MRESDVHLFSVDILFSFCNICNFSFYTSFVYISEEYDYTIRGIALNILNFRQRWEQNFFIYGKLTRQNCKHRVYSLFVFTAAGILWVSLKNLGFPNNFLWGTFTVHSECNKCQKFCTWVFLLASFIQSLNYYLF